ncbi:MAG: hypothetical protein ACREPJ_12100, partial [Rhodanobacteraceae bacterium]
RDTDDGPDKGRVMRSNRGGGWMGWALLCGVPGPLIAFAIAGPLGVRVGLATGAAFLVGRHLEHSDAAEDALKRARDEDPVALRVTR